MLPRPAPLLGFLVCKMDNEAYGNKNTQPNRKPFAKVLKHLLSEIIKETAQKFSLPFTTGAVFFTFSIFAH